MKQEKEKKRDLPVAQETSFVSWAIFSRSRVFIRIIPAIIVIGWWCVMGAWFKSSMPFHHRRRVVVPRRGQ
jgi:hypothetical protein